MKFFHLISILCITVVVVDCVEPYDPPASASNPNFLVVDAFVDVNNGSASVKLTRTVPLASNELPAFENNAIVSLEDESGSIYQLNNTTSGTYNVSSLNLDLTKKYRLNVRTTSNKEYQSDFVEIKVSPEIDSISYFTDEYDQLNINVNTHDATGGSRFYRWHVVETWEYQSNYPSGYILRDGIVYERPPAQGIHTCWRTDATTQIMIGTTQHLEQDIVVNYNLMKIPGGAFKIARKYSLLVQQTVLTPDAYEYWKNLKTTTEGLGGLFDPMPSQVVGNIRCISDPTEEVIGFFSGAYVSEKRIFITPDDLPEDFPEYRAPICLLDTIDIADLPKVTDPDALIFPIYPLGFPVVIGYATSDKKCIDCRALAGGVTTRPSFWE
jgi:hypothetical protein